MLTASLCGCITGEFSGFDDIMIDFDADISTVLKECYGIALPESAVFTSAQKVDGTIDPYFDLKFKVDKEHFEGMFNYDIWNEVRVSSCLKLEVGAVRDITHSFNVFRSYKYKEVDLKVKAIDDKTFEIVFRASC